MIGLYAALPILAIATGRTGNQGVSKSPTRYSLRPPRSAEDWAAYHAIRREAIFAPLLPGQAYDERDPDEFAPGNLPHVLVCDGEIVGVVRIDLIDQRQAGLRLIGIRADRQRRGHGGALLKLCEQAAGRFGRTDVVIKRAPDVARLLPRQRLCAGRLGGQGAGASRPDPGRQAPGLGRKKRMDCAYRIAFERGKSATVKRASP
jgi:GNAT superfamily N-acetyltransferase